MIVEDVLRILLIAVSTILGFTISRIHTKYTKKNQSRKKSSQESREKDKVYTSNVSLPEPKERSINEYIIDLMDLKSLELRLQKEINKASSSLALNEISDNERKYLDDLLEKLNNRLHTVIEKTNKIKVIVKEKISSLKKKDMENTMQLFDKEIAKQ